jgi:putative peptidoglycan lipid II flippase
VAQYRPVILAALLMSATAIVDQLMAARLESGDVAALNYGGKIVSFFGSVVTLAMATAVMPVFAAQIATDDLAGVRVSIRGALRTLLAATVPATVLIVGLSDPLVRAIFERGAFGAGDTALVSWIQRAGALQIPFFALSTLFARLLSAMRRNDVLCTGAGISLAVKIALNLLFIPAFGVAGIALATSIMYAVAFAYLSTRAMALLRERAGTRGVESP